MIEIKSKEQCCGCTACVNVCPQKCIKMESDEEGFLYPVVDKAKCVNCKLCERVCPLKDVRIKNPILEAKVIRCTDMEVLEKVTSGGVSTVISNTFYDNGNVVVGAKFDDTLEVVHAVAADEKDINQFMGSKYVQSNMQNVISEIKHLLSAGKKVLFIGTPCQVAAVSNCVNDDKNLYLIDFVCRAVPSAKILDDYLKDLSKSYKSKVTKVVFREKTYGYHNSTMSVYFSNGKKYSKSGRVDIYHKLFFEGLSIRQACEECKFRCENRSSDLTLLEAWHAERNIGKLKDDNKGYGTVLIRTEKGKELLDSCGAKLCSYDASVEQILKDDGYYLSNSIKRNEDREKFFATYLTYGLKAAAKESLQITFADKVFEAIKPILYKSGVLVKLKKIKHAIIKH